MRRPRFWRPLAASAPVAAGRLRASRGQHHCRRGSGRLSHQPSDRDRREATRSRPSGRVGDAASRPGRRRPSAASSTAMTGARAPVLTITVPGGSPTRRPPAHRGDIVRLAPRSRRSPQHGSPLSLLPGAAAEPGQPSCGSPLRTIARADQQMRALAGRSPATPKTSTTRISAAPIRTTLPRRSPIRPTFSGRAGWSPTDATRQGVVIQDWHSRADACRAHGRHGNQLLDARWAARRR